MADVTNTGAKAPARRQKTKSAPLELRLSAALINVLKTIVGVAFLSFLISESVYLLLLYAGPLNFPGSLIYCLVPVIAGTAIVDKFFSDEVTALTLLSSALGSIAVVDFLFGSSPSPTLFSFTGSVMGDALVMAIGALTAYGIARFLYSLVATRKISGKYFALTVVALSALGAVVLIYVYQSFVMEFFDQHPWLATILAVIVSSVVSFILATRKKERK
jgi:hypothetical protein